jgi:hypothetical protein
VCKKYVKDTPRVKIDSNVGKMADKWGKKLKYCKRCKKLKSCWVGGRV